MIKVSEPLMDSSKLISKLFEPKFALARTKCEAIILNVIGPMVIDELHEDLEM